MGLLFTDEQEDRRQLDIIFERFQTFWNESPPAVASKFFIRYNPDQTDQIIRYADQVFEQNFEAPNYLNRIAAMLVLVNICPCYRLESDGRVLSNLVQRRSYLARLSLLLLPAVFSTVSSSAKPQTKWRGYPERDKLEDMVTLLELMDQFDLVSRRDLSHNLKGLAKDIVMVSSLLKFWIEQPVDTASCELEHLLVQLGMAK